jgi:pimeloyl-ACP methyl ester carboxylesterase
VPSQHTSIELRGRHDLLLAGELAGRSERTNVLLLHGGGQTRHAWIGTMDALAERGWCAWAIDLRGHGDSEWDPAGDYSLTAIAADVRLVLEQIGGAVLVGASLGGLASLVAIGEAPGAPTVPGVVLVDIAPRADNAGVARVKLFMSQHIDGFDSLQDVANAIAAYQPHRRRRRNLDSVQKSVRRSADGRWYWHWDPRVLLGSSGEDQAIAILDAPRLEAAAAAIEVPALVVRGADSDVLSDDGARAVLGVMPNARHVDVSGAGHMVAGDCNDAFNGAILNFLDGFKAP